MSRRLRLALLGSTALVTTLVGWAPYAVAGGAIGWADSVTQVTTEGEAMGAVVVALGIIAAGAILMFGITGMITTVVMLCLGGALMANADAINAALFTGGAGGGSVLDVVVPPAQQHAVVFWNYAVPS